MLKQERKKGGFKVRVKITVLGWLSDKSYKGRPNNYYSV